MLTRSLIKLTLLTQAGRAFAATKRLPSASSATMRRSLLCLSFLVFVGACSSHKDACPAGSAGCLCSPTAQCNGALRCDSGYCIPTDCTPGDKGCTCATGQACNLDGNTRMSCIGGVCAAVAAPADGALGGACAENTPCGRAQDGRELVCVRGQCEMSGCPSGELHCGCGAFGVCAPQGDQTIYCGRDGLCGLGVCTPGTRSCACQSDGSCAAPLTCVGGLCRGLTASSQLTLHLGNTAVRACDLTLTADSSAGFGAIALSPAVLARHTLKSPQELVISFVARDATPLDVIANFAADDQALHVSVTTANCYDANGQAITEPNLTVN